LNGLSLSGVSRVLDQLKVVYKRGRGHVFSPDPYYIGKLDAIYDILKQCQREPDRYVLMLEDELTFYRHPSLARDWAQKGHDQPLAEMGHSRNQSYRIAGALNAFSGQVVYCMDDRMGVEGMIRLLRKVKKTYSEAEQIFIILDNWPVHYHVDVMAALCPQQIAWPLPDVSYVKSAPSASARRLNLPIRLVPLPTYAPWTNPIEKLWRWLYQDVLHQHRFSDDWTGLRDAVHEFLDGFACGSLELLRYVGLTDPERFYGRARENARLAHGIVA